MSKLRVQSFTVSVDGYGAGPRQDRDRGLGVGGEELRKWFVPTRTFKSMSGGQVGRGGGAISPVLLGSGEHLLSGLDLPALGYRVEEHTPSEAAMHLVLKPARAEGR